MALLLAGAPGRGQDRENPYDVLDKALLPIANSFVTRDQNGEQPARHGLVLDAHLVEASKLPDELQGQSAHVALMAPDELLVQAPIAGDILTVCRDGDALWATPGSKIQYLLNDTIGDTSPAAAATPEGTPGKKKKKHKSGLAKILGPMALPVPQKELVFLPVLFQVADAGDQVVGGVSCRVLDVQLMPPLEKSLHAEGWTARMWVGADYGIAKIALKGPDWSGTVVVDKVAFPPALPESTFQPQGNDVLRLSAGQFLELMGRVGRE